jgi:photosynthetic reaction center cytochrome c subunit
MRRLAIFVTSLLALVLLARPALAQWPPERTKNVKVLPADIPIRALVDTMRSFTRALGVRCTYCHVGQESDPLDKYDFASDEKPAKLEARAMLRMVAAINGEHLTKLASRREPAIAVACITCHRGVTEPRQLQQILLTAYAAGGVDSVQKTYDALRQRYYGRSAYDFGEVPLADVAAEVAAQQKLTDAVRLHVYNTQVVPTSGFAFRQAAGAQLAAGDTASAIASLEKALAINANDQQARGLLGRLRK